MAVYLGSTCVRHTPLLASKTFHLLSEKKNVVKLRGPLSDEKRQTGAGAGCHKKQCDAPITREAQQSSEKKGQHMNKYSTGEQRKYSGIYERHVHKNEQNSETVSLA